MSDAAIAGLKRAGHHMSEETRKALGISKQSADFDELLQLDDDDPRKAELQQRLGAKRVG